MIILLEGTIYQSNPGGAPAPVIAPADLGLAWDVDLDAFELCWLEHPAAPSQRALALLFSVDDDDPWSTMEDESGGLDPRVIYYSFLDGSHGELLPPLDDDVDPAVDVAILSAVPVTPALDNLPRDPGGRHAEDLAAPGSQAGRLLAVLETTAKPVVVVVDSGEIYDPLCRRFEEAGIPVFRKIDRAARSLAAFCRG